jgi:hypothetical protein
MAVRKPVPKAQSELSQGSITAYTNRGKSGVKIERNRAENRKVTSDDVKQFSIGLRDIDETIVYYFNNVIKPSVLQNGTRKNVPIIYGSPERWAAVQKDGFYRDKNGKIQAPLIMYKRDSLEKNRSLGNKLDANNPVNFGIFEKKFSMKNVYDRFSILNNRDRVKEYYGVIIPDYVNITYSCIIFTDYVEQMNKIIESVNFAADSYWGDPERFKFRAMIDNFTTITELNQGEDRKVRTEFKIDMLGHIVSDSINAQLNGLNKFYSKSAISFKIETAGNIETLNARADTPEADAGRRFFDTALVGAQKDALPPGMNEEEIAFVALHKAVLADTVSTNLVTFNNRTIAAAPAGFTITQSSFQVYINGIIAPESARTVTQVDSDIIVTFDAGILGYNVDSDDQVLLVGKYS